MTAPEPSDSASTRDRILVAALDVLEHKGPANIGIRAVAERAGVSVGLVHHHFESKDGLLEACVATFHNRLIEEEAAARASLVTSDDLAEALAAAVTRGYRISVEHRVLVRVVIRMVADRGALPLVWRSGVQDMFLLAWSQILAEQTGRPAWRLRAQIHSVMSMAGRYAAASREELAAILGEPELSEDELRRRIEEHLGSMARGILGTANLKDGACAPER